MSKLNISSNIKSIVDESAYIATAANLAPRKTQSKRRYERLHKDVRRILTHSDNSHVKKFILAWIPSHNPSDEQISKIIYFLSIAKQTDTYSSKDLSDRVLRYIRYVCYNMELQASALFQEVSDKAKVDKLSKSQLTNDKLGTPIVLDRNDNSSIKQHINLTQRL